jgi:hypothetical protein
MVSESTGGTTISAAPGGETSPLTWYGRLGVWLGAFMLLLQSVTGRGAGVTTVVAVAALTIGLTVFLAGLASAAFDRKAQDSPAEDPAGDGRPQRTIEPATPDLDQEMAQIEREEVPSAEPVGGELANGAFPRIEERGIRALKVPAGASEAGELCPRCREDVQVGQIAATCFVCGAVHHAGCWVANGFGCATPGCAGRGDLEAPKRDGAPGELGV